MKRMGPEALHHKSQTCGPQDLAVNVESRPDVKPSLQRFRIALVTLAGIELMRRIRKAQCNLAGLHFKDSAAPEVWNIVLPDQ